MRARSIALLAAFLATMTAGCLSDGTSDGDGAEVVPPSHGLASDLPCAATEVGEDTSDNLRVLGHGTFHHPDDPERQVYSRDIDIRGDLLLSPGGNGLGIMDISDPRQPVALGQLRDIGGELDVKFSPDNQTALLGGSDGIVLVDIRDPDRPAVEGYWNFSQMPAAPALIQDPVLGTMLNAHMIYSARIADEDWVFLAPNANSGVWILRMVGEPGQRGLEYVTQTLPVQGGPLGPHDMWVTHDEQEEAWLLYSADGFHGWTVFNVDDPTAPMLVGGHVRPETGYTHTIQAGDVDGRRIVATIQEVGVNLLEVYDATHLQAPVLLATWTLGPEELPQPQHNIQIVNGTLFVAHYTQGFYVFDLRDAGTVPGAGTATLAPVAHFSADMEHGAPTLDFGGVYDVIVHEGLVWASSYTGPATGITSVAYGCFQPGDKALTSTG